MDCSNFGDQKTKRDERQQDSFSLSRFTPNCHKYTNSAQCANRDSRRGKIAMGNPIDTKTQTGKKARPVNPANKWVQSFYGSAIYGAKIHDHP